MVRKDCPDCGRSWYSAAEREPWWCQYCGMNLEKEPLLSIHGERSDKKEVLVNWKK